MSMTVRSLLPKSVLVVAALTVFTGVNSAQAAWKETVRNSFEVDKDGSGNGYNPRFGVLLNGGHVYGVTMTGGVNGGGVAYRLTDGKMKALYSFFVDPDKDKDGCGYQPSSRLIKDPSKLVLYGTTYYGGAKGVQEVDDGDYTGGVIFSLTPSSDSKKPWVCKALHSFAKKDKKGFAPFGGLIVGSDGLLYGTTQYNTTKTNSNGIVKPTGGVVFRIAKTGSSYKVLHTFSGQSKGLIPAGPVVEGPGGILYGATFFGGKGNAGAVYKLAMAGTGYAVIHSFGKGPDTAESGYQPTQGALVLNASKTSLYGATTMGGCKLDSDKQPQCDNKDSAPAGVLYRLKISDGDYKVLYRFDSGSPGVEKGYSPYGGLVMDAAGSLYGVTQFGGPQNAGAAFRLKSGQYSVLSGFGDDDGGVTPSGPLTLDSSGNAYGATFFGGDDNGGVLYFLDKP